LKNRITLLFLSGALLGFDLPSPVPLQGGATPYTFDVVAVHAIALYLESPTWSSKLNPPPSEGFTKLLITQPQNLLFLADKWFYSASDSPNGSQPVEVDSQKYPVESNDIEVVKKILNVNYISQYITCMREAYRGNGKGECIKILYDAAIQAGEQLHDPSLTQYLQADLGGRLLALSSNSPEWKDALEERETRPEVNLVLKANAALEEQKAIAVSSGAPPKDTGNIPVIFKLVQVRQSGTDWSDFLTHVDIHTKEGKRNFSVYAWRIVGRKASLISLHSKPDVYTITIDPKRGFLITGQTLTYADLDDLFASDTWMDLTKKTLEKKAAVYLSRPGSGTLGKLELANSVGFQ
jgi:hypothetical protein